MDSVFAIKGADFVLVVQEKTVAKSIFKLKNNENKIQMLDDHLMLAMSGEPNARGQMGNYIAKNIQLFKYMNNWRMSVSEAANWIRKQLAEAIRKNPMQVNSVLAGYDSKGPGLYWLDVYGTCVEANFAAQGYCSYFVNSVLNNSFKKGLTQEECVTIANQCIHELRSRFLIGQDNFEARVIDSSGARIVQLN